MRQGLSLVRPAGLVLSAVAIFGLSLSQAGETSTEEKAIRALADRVYQHVVKAGTRDIMPELDTGLFSFKKNQCIADDRIVHEIETSVLRDLIESLRARDLKEVFLTVGESHFGFRSQKISKDSDRIVVSNLTAAKASADQKKTFASYLSDFSSISDMSLEVADYHIPKRDRDNNFSELSVFLRMDVRGQIKSQSANDQLQVVMDFEKSKVAGSWIPKSIAFVSGVRVASSGKASFRDATAESGLSAIKTHLRREAIRRGGYSVSVADVNNDQIQDVYVGTGGKSQLFLGSRNAGEKTTKFAAVNSPLNSSTFVKSSVFADFDNDGDQDAVLVRFVKQLGLNRQVVYFENRDGKFFENKSRIKNLKYWDNYAMPAAVGDFDRNGFLDVYVGFPGKQDFTTLSNGISNKQPHGLFYNDGKNFVNQLAKLPQDGPSNVFPHSAIAVDYDQDQKTDLVVIDDRNNLSPVFKNEGENFVQTAEAIGMGNQGHGMSIATGDFNSDGLIDFAMTNVVTSSDERISRACLRNWGTKLITKHERGLVLFQNMGGGKFAEVTAVSGISWPGSATAGLVFFDYDNDGLEDLYVVNGLWSGSPNSSDASTVWTHLHLTDYWQDTIKYSFSNIQSELMNLLIHFNGDLYTNRVIDGYAPSFAGYQRNRLYKNLGNSRFVEVGYLEGLDAIEDGYAVVTTDLNSDGKTDLILRNADPGSEKHTFAPLKVFMNESLVANQSMTIKLVETHSNKDAIGAEVIVSYGDRKQVKQLIANNGPQQYERSLHFGLGNALFADVQVKWPCGKVTEIKSLPAGFHTLTDDVRQKQIVKN